MIFFSDTTPMTRTTYQCLIITLMSWNLFYSLSWIRHTVWSMFLFMTHSILRMAGLTDKWIHLIKQITQLQSMYLWNKRLTNLLDVNSRLTTGIVQSSFIATKAKELQIIEVLAFYPSPSSDFTSRKLCEIWLRFSLDEGMPRFSPDEGMPASRVHKSRVSPGQPF